MKSSDCSIVFPSVLKPNAGTISIQLLIVHVHSKGVFGLSLKLTFMMIFFLLCPSQWGFLFVADRNRCGIDNSDLFLRSSLAFSSDSFSTPTDKSGRQSVADNRTHRAVVWKSLATSESFREEPKVLPTSSAPARAATTTTNPRRGRSKR